MHVIAVVAPVRAGLEDERLRTSMSAPVEAVAGVFGLVIGSFVGVVVDRLPRKESIVSPPSHCVACSAPIRAYDNVPVVSYLLLRGRCRVCRRPHPASRRDVGARDRRLSSSLLAWRSPSVWELPALLCPGRESRRDLGDRRRAPADPLVRSCTAPPCSARRSWCSPRPARTGGRPCWRR